MRLVILLGISAVSAFLGIFVGTANATLVAYGPTGSSRLLVSGSGFWGGSAPGTPESIPEQPFSFSFAQPSSIPKLVGLPTGIHESQTSAVTGAVYRQNGNPVGVSISSVTYYPKSLAGLFDLNMSDGNVIDAYGADVGSTGNISTGTYSARFDVNHLNQPSGLGTGTVKIRKIPSINSSLFINSISNSWYKGKPDPVGDYMYLSFKPKLTGIGTLSKLASLEHFDHFNIEQDITKITGPALPISLPRSTGIDPLLGGNPGQQADHYPWYLDEFPVTGKNVKTFYYKDKKIMTKTTMRWRDRPVLSSALSPNKYAGTKLYFTDYLVGVYADHTGVRISDLFPSAQNINFKWTFTQGLFGNSDKFTSFFTNNVDAPIPGSAGSINFLGFFGNNPQVLSPISATVPEPSSISVLGTALGILTFIMLISKWRNKRGLGFEITEAISCDSMSGCRRGLERPS